MIGIIAAGGTGSRLGPLTAAVNKHLLPLYDKPMIFYPLSTVMAAGARRIVIVTLTDAIPSFQRLLGDGSAFGIGITYVSQDEPRGVADVIRVARPSIECEPFVFVLGDNFFYGPGLGRHLAEIRPDSGGHVFAASVKDPSAYGVVVMDSQGQPTNIVEKPQSHESNLAIPGLYFYGRDVWPFIEHLSPSARGELEISDLNRALLLEGKLSVTVLPRGTVWMDAGTVDDLEQASEFVSVVQHRQGQLIGSPEEIAMANGWIDLDAVGHRAASYSTSSYGQSLRKFAEEGQRTPDTPRSS